MNTFPDYLLIHMAKFTVGEDWVERKLGKLMRNVLKFQLKKWYCYLLAKVCFCFMNDCLNYSYFSLEDIYFFLVFLQIALLN